MYMQALKANMNGGFMVATCSIRKEQEGNTLILSTVGGEDPGVKTLNSKSPAGGHDGMETGAEYQYPQLLHQPPDNLKLIHSNENINFGLQCLNISLMMGPRVNGGPLRPPTKRFSYQMVVFP